MAPDVALDQLFRSVPDEVRAHPDPRLIRHRELLRACAPADGEPLRVSAVGDVAGEPRLSDSRLSSEKHDLPRTAAHVGQRALPERRALDHPPDIRTPGEPNEAAPAAASAPPTLLLLVAANGAHDTENASTRSGKPFSSSSPAG